MPAIQNLLRRWGFVKLRRYGLELTSDGRIVSNRPAVLDVGTGSRIVGWQDGDVAIWKLSAWDKAPVEPPMRVIPAALVVEDMPLTRPSARVMPVGVAGEAPVDEDDWEWTIALARARVAVEEAEAAVADYEDYRVSTRPTLEIPSMAASARAATPSTVIPVPALPLIDDAVKSRMEPVVRTAQLPAALAGRFAKGTGQLDPPSSPRAAAVLIEDTIPNLSVGDRTTPGVAPARASAEAIGDRTQPGIALPPAARTVALPSIKGRLAPR